MRMTGLQAEPFDVSLYVFYEAWLNDNLSRFGYEHRGFERRFRDHDSKQCTPNAGKEWSNPKGDPYLARTASLVPELTQLFQSFRPGKRYYLTQIVAKDLDPGLVRAWSDDLWLFPYYTDRSMVPHDARPGGVARTGYDE